MTALEKEAHLQKVIEVGDWYMNNQLPAMRIVAQQFDLSTAVATSYVTKYFKLMKIGLKKK